MGNNESIPRQHDQERGHQEQQQDDAPDALNDANVAQPARPEPDAATVVVAAPHISHQQARASSPRILHRAGSNTQNANLDDVKNAWRAFKGWDLGSKLSLGMILSHHEIAYLQTQLKKLPACFRPSKLHFWDNSTSTGTIRPGAVQNFGDLQPLFALCQTSVRDVEWHGFGGVPPLHQYDDNSVSASTHAINNSDGDHRLSSLESIRFYHLDLRGRDMGRRLRSLFLFPGSTVHTIYLARCSMDLDMLREFAVGLHRVRGTLRTLVFVHCQMTDDMLETILDSLSAPLTPSTEVQFQGAHHDPQVNAPLVPHPPHEQNREQQPNPQGIENDHQDQPHPAFAPPPRAMHNADNDGTTATTTSTPHLDLCVHANRLTIRSIGTLARFLARYELLRSVTLHANPHIDALFHATAGLTACPELEEFLRVIQTQNTSLRHFSWHNCKRANYAHHNSNQQATINSNNMVCEACWQMDQVFVRNRWLALSKKLELAMEDTPSHLWPHLLAKLCGRGTPATPAGSSSLSATSSSPPPSAMHPGAVGPPTALFSFLRTKHVDLAAVRRTDVRHFLAVLQAANREGEEDGPHEDLYNSKMKHMIESGGGSMIDCSR